MAHKMLIGGTAYEISGGKTLVDGTAYSIKSGKTLVGGTAYEMGFGLKLDVPDGMYLTFASANEFTIATYNGAKNWDGTLYYYTGNSEWSEWDGTTTIASANSDGEQRIYLRGSGNSVITGSKYDYRWVITGSNVKCDGNIECLLDYEAVVSGNHPTMGDYCYAYMFKSCTCLTTAPSLPATTLAAYCYTGMFWDCTSLTTLPSLPATTLPVKCYMNMFYNCTCIKLSTTATGEYQTAYRIPTSGTGSSNSLSLSAMFSRTGGTFAGTATINTTYYTSNSVVY